MDEHEEHVGSISLTFTWSKHHLNKLRQDVYRIYLFILLRYSFFNSDPAQMHPSLID